MSEFPSSRNRYFAYRSFYPEIATMQKFRLAGVDTFAVMISNCFNALGTPYTKYPMVWTARDTYDLAAADAAFNDILKEIPDAKFIALVDLNTPLWWTRYLGAHGARHDSYADLGRIASSTLWRNDTAKYMKTLLKHLDETFDGRIRAYAFGCGGGTEWQDRNRGEGSLFRLTAFKQWMAEKGKAVPEDIPPISKRENGTREFSSFSENDHEKDFMGYWYGYDDSEIDPEIRRSHGGLFFDPEQSRDVIDYWTFCNAEMAGTIDFFLKEARKVTRPGVELGAIYGYVTSTGQYTLSSSGHLGYEKLLSSDALDFLLAPATDGGMGGGSGSHCAVGTVHRHGKQVLNSSDNKTCYSRGPDGQAMNEAWKVWHDEDQIKAGIKREVAFNLINQTSMWFFDMWGGSFSDQAIDVLAQAKKIWDQEAGQPASGASQILMVVDPENLYYLNSMHPRAHCFHLPWKLALNRCGAPFLITSFNDLPHLEMQRIKLVIFCHPFEINAENRIVLDKYVLNHSRTVLWSYGPGIINQRKWDPDNVKKVCGTMFATPGIQPVTMNGWTSIYVHKPDIITPEKLREIAREAGVWLYGSEPCPVYANDRLVALHSGKAGKLKVAFPRKYAVIRELFTRKEYHATDQVEIISSGPDTWLFRLE